MSHQTVEKIEQQLKDNKVVLYMKGTPQFPQCGFSAKVADILKTFPVKYAYVNVLANPDIRAELPVYAEWRTFPQLWIEQELVGGCDIISEMYESGELKSALQPHLQARSETIEA